MTLPLTAQRLDLWFYYARLAKTRSLCAKFIKNNPARLNGRPILKAHTLIRRGDIVTFPSPSQNDHIHVWRVKNLGQRRGPASEARLLYEEIYENDKK